MYNCSQNLKYFAVNPLLPEAQGQANMRGGDLLTKTDGRGRAVQSQTFSAVMGLINSVGFLTEYKFTCDTYLELKI